MMCRILIFLFILPMCAAGQRAMVTRPSDTLRSPEEIVLPEACQLLSVDSIGRLMGVAPSDIMVIDPPAVGEQGVSGCFYKWLDPATPNAGMFLQLMKHPAYDSYPEYIRSYVDDKLASGEAMPGRPGTFQYAELQVEGIRVAWCYEQSRFYWNLGSNHLCMLAFNLPSMGREEMVEKGSRIVSQIGRALIPESAR